jgi:hypothetical protein
MKILPIAIFGTALVAGLLLAGRTAEAKDFGSQAHRIAAVRGLAAEAGLPPEWGDFYALVAMRESKGVATAFNDSPSEAEAAATAYERNAERFEHCGIEASEYGKGSGGWFGLLPAVGLSQLNAELRCLPPDSVMDPRAAMAMAVGLARGLMTWNRYEQLPTWLNLRAMWGWPAKGGDVEYLAMTRPAYTKNAAAVGLPASWLDRRPPPLTMTSGEVLHRLKGDDV